MCPSNECTKRELVCKKKHISCSVVGHWNGSFSGCLLFVGVNSSKATFLTPLVIGVCCRLDSLGRTPKQLPHDYLQMEVADAENNSAYAQLLRSELLGIREEKPELLGRSGSRAFGCGRAGGLKKKVL